MHYGKYLRKLSWLRNIANSKVYAEFANMDLKLISEMNKTTSKRQYIDLLQTDAFLFVKGDL